MDRFIDERVRGYRDTSGKYHPAVSKAEAEAKWVHSRDKFSDVLMVGDQDIVERLHVFGFYRNWPGLNKGYEDATSAVKEFLELLPKTHEMNLFMAKNAKDKVIKLRPSDYPTVESLQQATKKIRRFFASKAAREDIRLQSVYEDDFVQISCPITYAAAVRYGWDGWPFAKVETFEENLEGNGNKWSDAWRKSTKEDENVIVYIQFHVPMPSWVSYDKAKFCRFTLQNLALFVKRKHLRSVDPWSVSLLDEEGRTALNLQAVKEMVLKEPKRIYDPAEEEYPLHVGPPVYESEAQAVEVVEHLATGIAALEKWLSKFDPKVITSDYMPEA